MKIQSTYYKIKESGFYDFRNSTHLFANIQEGLTDLQVWATGKNLGETCTFPIDGGAVAGCYLFDVIEDKTNKEFLVTLWNAAPKMKEGMSMVNGKAAVGDAKVSSTSIGKDQIPGYPTYFWIIPAKNTYVMLIPETCPNFGNGNFTKYIHYFLGGYSKWRIREADKTENETIILGYGADGKTKQEYAEARFTTGYHHTQGDIEVMRKQCAQIRKIVKRERVILGVTGDEHVLTTIFKWVGLTEGDIPEEPTYRLRYEVSRRLDENEFDAIVAEWNKHSLEKGSDVGFKMEHDTKVHWLGRTVVRNEHEWKVADTNGVVDPKSLFSKITEARITLLACIPAIHAVAKKAKAPKKK